MRDYGEFCASKNCPEFIAWDYEFESGSQPYPCESCKKMGQSYTVSEYPEDCIFLGEIRDIKLETCSA